MKKSLKVMLLSVALALAGSAVWACGVMADGSLSAGCGVKSSESKGGGDVKSTAADSSQTPLKACGPGCEAKIAKGERPACCVAAAKGGGDVKSTAADSSQTPLKACGPGCEAKIAKGERPACCVAAAKGGGAEKDTAQAANTSAYKVGSTVSDFTLKEARSGKDVALSSLAGEKATVLVFWNQQCPFVRDVQDRIDAFNKAYSEKGVKVVAIDAGVNNTDEEIKQHAERFSFPILINKDSRVASQFGATRTPEVFVLDKSMNVLYHGAFDSGTLQGGDTPEKNYVITFVDNMLAGKPNDVTQTKPFGCSLKYAPGTGPAR